MRKLTAILWLSASLCLKADFDPVKISNFQGSYQDPEGSASASEFMVPDEVGLSGPGVFRLLREEAQFTLLYSDGEYVYEDAPELILGLERFSFRGINIRSEGARASLNIGQISGTHELGGLELRELSLKCEGSANFEEEVEKYISVCLTNASGSLGALDVKGETEIEVTRGEFEIEDNSLELEVRVDLPGLPRVTVKVAGRTHYLASEKTVRVRIDRARALGDRRDEIFEALSGVEGLRVERPFVFIPIND